LEPPINHWKASHANRDAININIYGAMEPVCNAMMQWINEHGYTPTGVAYEFYYNSPDQVPERLVLTKIVFPLK